MDERHVESMLFNYQTTQRNDYREYKIQQEVPVAYKPKAPKPKPPYTPLKDLHSIAERKDPCVPFSLMHTPKEIVRTSPYKVQEAFRTASPFCYTLLSEDSHLDLFHTAVCYVRLEEDKRLLVGIIKTSEMLEKEYRGYASLDRNDEQQSKLHIPPDEGKEQSRATRPRLVMTPAVSMDDISDNQVRELLVQDMYNSSAHRAMEEAVRLVRKKPVAAPLPGLPACAKPIRLGCLREPVVSPEWRMESVSWDRRQLRGHVDPEREFWMKFDLYKDCVSCKEFAQVTKMRKLKAGQH